MFDAYELAVLAGLNFTSIFLTLALLKWFDGRRKRQIAKTIMTELGEKLELDQNFSDIVRKSFFNDEGGSRNAES